MNLDRIVAHRGVLITALGYYGKQLEKIKKLEEDAELETNDTDRKLGIIEVLKSEFVDQRGLLLEGTPMGDSMTEAAYTDGDGAVLSADNLERMLERVGVDAPFESITAWTLNQRKDVRAFCEARLQAVLDDAPMPDLIPLLSEAWLVSGDPLLEGAMPDAEVEAFISAGPWGVRSVPGASPSDPDDWQVYAKAHEHNGVQVDERVHGQTYGQLDRARLVAANLNAIERGKALAAAHATDAPTADREEVAGVDGPVKVDASDVEPAAIGTPEEAQEIAEREVDDLAKKRKGKSKAKPTPAALAGVDVKAAAAEPDPYA